MSATATDRPVRLLHLSDCRFRADRAREADPMLRDLAGFIRGEVLAGLIPDLVVITGDLGFSGKAEEYQPGRKRKSDEWPCSAQEWLEDQLWPALSPDPAQPLPRDRLLLVPGNHDVDWDLVSRLARSAQSVLLTERSQDAIAEVLGHAADRDLLLKRHAAYLKFYGTWLGTDQPDPWWQRRFDIRGQHLHVAGLDSAWMACRDQDRDLLLGRYQVNQTVLHQEAEGANWRIALMHHPWDDLAAFDSNEARQTIHLHCDLLLHGHRREPLACRVMPPDARRACLELAPGYVNTGSGDPNRFQWIELHPRPRCVRVLFRLRNQGAWQPDYNQSGGAVEFALDQPPTANTATQSTPEVPAAYLAWLHRRYADFDLLGKGLKQGQAIRLSQVYVPAVTTPAADPAGPDLEPAGSQANHAGRPEQPPPALLLERIDGQSLYCPAAAGAGKTTFCRWAVLRASGEPGVGHALPPPADFAEQPPAGLHGRLPLLVPLWDLWPNMECGHGRGNWHRPQLEQALAQWVDRIQPDGLTGELLKAHLAAGTAFLLLDGLDEVPVCETRDGRRIYPRGLLLSGLIAALPEWERAGNRTLLTSRPYGLDDQELDRLGLDRAPLQPLPDALQTLFITRWFQTLGKPELAQDLMRSLGDQDLDALTENPLLLTALCVIYYDGGRLPGDLWSLYAAICDNVLHNRYLDKVAERPLALARLEAIAYGMHTGEGLHEHRGTPQRFATEDEIAQLLRDFAKLDGKYEQGQVAPVAWREDLLTKSGLLLPQSQRRAAFYHLSIQEFLAAERIARNRGDDAALHQVFRSRWDVPEWRLTLLFLFAGLAFHHRSSPTAALDLLAGLARELDRAKLKVNPAPAVFVAEALGLCLAKKALPDELATRFRRTCLDAIADAVEVKARQTLGLCLGRLGDPRIADLRDPRAYVEVPAGVYICGDQNKKFRIEAPFLLSRYPVTNSQYRVFMDAGGYAKRDWWSDEGWAWLQQASVTEPAFWQVRRWNVANQPVVGVSFWEAQACCRWAGGRLPSDLEWEAAARGPQGYEYPWGGTWEDGICNSVEAGLGVTSPVGLFPRSAQAPLGLDDMAGNCWEWCDDIYSEDSREGGSPRVLRGGAFWYEAWFLRSANRNWFEPGLRNGDIGFRCVLAARHQP